MKEKRTISKMVSKNIRIDVKVQEFVGVAGDVKYILKEYRCREDLISLIPGSCR